MALDSEQKAITRSALIALAVSSAMLVATGVGVWVETKVLADRLALVAMAFVPLALSLGHDVARLARHRFFDPLDRNAAAAGTRTTKADMLGAILRNTHEQVTFAALVYAIAALVLPVHWTDAVPGCALLFLIGRIIFANGYAKGAGSRAFGFALTFYPSVALAMLTALTAIL